MAFRELTVVELREILRRWREGQGYRSVAAHVGADRKTVRRYVESAQACGFNRQEGSCPLDDALLAALCERITPGAPARVGAMRLHCRAHRDLIDGWLKEGCKAPKVIRLLHRHTGVMVPRRTLNRFIEQELQLVRDKGTVRIVDPEPGQILEIDFMELGKGRLPAPGKLYALVCVASFSRHMFVWPCTSTTTQDVIEGLEAAWAFFGGVFPIVVSDNPKTLVAVPHPLNARLNEDIAEYSQSRGFLVDTARVRRPQDKPRVERAVSYVRNDGFAAERLLSLDDARRHIAQWCLTVAGTRLHGTTRQQPLQRFEQERSLLLPAPAEPYDTPRWTSLKVGRDHAVVVAQALYSVPHLLRGRQLRVRYDRKTVKMYEKGALVKMHARAAKGASQIDPQDLPPGTVELATRDTESLAVRARAHGEHVGQYAKRVLDGPLPWTRMRHIYRLLGLCKRFGSGRVDRACATALSLDVIDVTRIDRMLTRGLDGSPPPQPPPRRGQVLALRFGRDPSEFQPPTQGGGDAS